MLFFKKKSDRRLMILMMDCHTQGELLHVMNEMAEKEKHYAMETVRHSFVMLLYGKQVKQYKSENVTGLFPNQWEAPLYQREKPDRNKIAVACAKEYIRKNLKGLDPESVVITVNEFPGKDYAGVSFEY